MVMDLLGASLNALFESAGRKFDVKTCCLVGQNMIRAVYDVHAKGIIHRDIKPDNFCIATRGDTDLTKDNLKIIDFGISKYYWKNGAHIPLVEGKKQCGTARYCSLATHLGYEPSRRDDLETVGHVLLYFARGGHLPWMGLPGATK